MKTIKSKILLLMLIIGFPLMGFAQEAERGIDERINEWFTPISNAWQDIVLYGIPYPKKERITVAVTIDTIAANADSILFTQLKSIPNTLFLDRAVGSEEVSLVVDKRKSMEAVQSQLSNIPFVKSADEQKGSLPLVIILLVLGALFFTLYFGFVNIRKFPLAINVVRGKYDDVEKHGVSEKAAVNIVDGDIIGTIRDEGKDGEVSHFQALATAVSGTVGNGNIAGVALAIALGGPGATFWMIICGLIGMSTKFVECTLGVKYRDVGEDGTVYGGPMYYLTKGLKDKGFVTAGKILAGIFAFLCIGASFGGGNAAQSNQAAQEIASYLGMTGGSARTIIGIVMMILVGIIIIGGIKRIAQVTEKVVPFMALMYIIACLYILGINFNLIGEAFGQIFGQAFTPQAGLGGLVGVLIVGFQRAAFSNEAGAGSASIAHSAVKTKFPASEGLVALLEPFIDTVVICTLTALVIIIFNSGQGEFLYGGDGTGVVVIGGESLQGAGITSAAFGKYIPFAQGFLMTAVVLFAVSTMISWSYYGLQSWMFLFGKSRVADLSYKSLFLIFIVIGAAGDMSSVWGFSDAMILALVFPNMIGLIILFPVVKAELSKYLSAIRAS